MKLLEILLAPNDDKLLIQRPSGVLEFSQNEKNPYVSKDLSILKYSVPEFIHGNQNLMKIIDFMQDAKMEDGGSGAFYIHLKKKRKK